MNKFGNQSITERNLQTVCVYIVASVI